MTTQLDPILESDFSPCQYIRVDPFGHSLGTPGQQGDLLLSTTAPGRRRQYEFASLLGIPTKPHPTVTGTEHAVLAIDSDYGKANSWLTDVTFVDRIPAISVLLAITLPGYGGTTTWANTVTAYDGLDPGLKALAARLWAVHSNLYDYVADRDEKRIGGIDVHRNSPTAMSSPRRSSRRSTQWSGFTRRPANVLCCWGTS